MRAWYKRNARDLPWRRTRDAYHVLVSELMLQHTQVSRVVDYYGEFLDRFPTLAHVARASAGNGAGLGTMRALFTAGEYRDRGAGQRFPPGRRARAFQGLELGGAVASFAYERAPWTPTSRVCVFAPSVKLKTTKGQRVGEPSHSAAHGAGDVDYNQALMAARWLRAWPIGRCPVRA